jgi:hypothetical protein
MKKFKTVEVPQDVIINYVCDKCKIESKDGFFPYIHTLHIDWNYGSKFDGDMWEVDLCENCLIEMLEGTDIQQFQQYRNK